MRLNTPTRTLRYGLAIVFVIVASAVCLGLDPALSQIQDFLALTLAVLAARRVGGRPAGLFATTLSVISAWFFFVDPRYSFGFPGTKDLGSLALLAFVGAGISFLGPFPWKAPDFDAGKHSLQATSPGLWRISLLGSAFLVLLVMTRLLYADFERESSRQYRVTHTYQVLNALRGLLSTLEHAETEQRGYLLTGDSRYLVAFNSAIQARESARNTLRQLTGDNPDPKPRLNQLDRLMEAGVSRLRESISLRQSGGAEAAFQAFQASEGTRTMEACRVLLGTIEDGQRALLEMRSKAAEAQALRTRWVLGLSSGALLALLVIAGTVIERDSQKRERDRQIVRNSEERLRLALDAAGAGTWEWDTQTNEHVWSPELWKLYGIQPHSCVPSYEAWRQVVHPDDLAQAEQIVDEAARTASELNVEFRVRDYDGGERWLLARARPERSAHGRAVRYLGIALDITRRKQAEESLRERERNLRRFTEIAPVSIAMFDREMRYLAVSERFRSDFRLGARELLGHSHYEIFPEISENWRQIHRRCLAGAVEHHPGEPFLRADAEEQWVRWEIQPWRQADGEVGGIVLFTEDITLQIRSHQAVRESETRLRLAQQAARVGTFEWNIQSGVNCWTPELEAMYGLPAGGFEGTLEAWERLVYAEDRPQALRCVRDALEKDGFEGEWRVQWPDGTLRWLAGRGSVFKDEAGKPLRLVGVNIDITERRLAEEASRRWQRAFEQAELAIALSNPNAGTFQAVNASFARERGYTVSELDGRSISDLFPASEHAALRDWITAADRDGHVSFESHHLRKDGTCFPVLIDLTMIRSETGEPVSRVAFVHNLTAQKQAEQQIRQLNAELEKRVRERTAQLEATNKELEAFAYSVSHDLRAPLRGIDGWSLALVEDYAGQLDQKAHTYLGRVRSETQRMGLLIDDLLQLSRITRSDMNQDRVDLTSVARAVAARLAESHAGREIEFLIAPGLAAVGDARLLEIAITNLLGNAVKFTGPQRHARIEFGQAECQGERAFYVRDNGVGFDMAFAKTLFGAFQRLHKTSEFPGTGIGLATVQRIVHRHGGRIWADARPGQGATFYFTIGTT